MDSSRTIARTASVDCRQRRDLRWLYTRRTDRDCCHTTHTDSAATDSNHDTAGNRNSDTDSHGDQYGLSHAHSENGNSETQTMMQLANPRLPKVADYSVFL
jgi:hypothetical protein